MEKQINSKLNIHIFVNSEISHFIMRITTTFNRIRLCYFCFIKMREMFKSSSSKLCYNFCSNTYSWMNVYCILQTSQTLKDRVTHPFLYLYSLSLSLFLSLSHSLSLSLSLSLCIYIYIYINRYDQSGEKQIDVIRHIVIIMMSRYLDAFSWPSLAHSSLSSITVDSSCILHPMSVQSCYR